MPKLHHDFLGEPTSESHERTEPTKIPTEEGYLFIAGIITIAVVAVLLPAIGFKFWMAKRKEARKNDVEQPKEKLETSPSSRRIPMDAMRKGNVKVPSLDEFNNLMTFTDDISNRFTTAQGKRYNKEPAFNLDPDVLPFDHNRVCLRNTADKIDYVNASWLAEISEEPSYDEVIYTKYALSLIHI